MAGKRKNPWKQVLPVLLLALVMVPAVRKYVAEIRVSRLKDAEMPDWIQTELIDVDGTSRRGTQLEDIRGIVIHYVGNPGTTAMQNRNWFANSASEVSSHFVVGLQGEVIQCIPLWERSCASNHRNKDTISIEVCHPDESGEFDARTYEALVELTVWLLEVCDLDAEDVIRHYDITGKLCPKYYVENPDSWEVFLGTVTRAAE